VLLYYGSSELVLLSSPTATSGISITMQSNRDVLFKPNSYYDSCLLTARILRTSNNKQLVYKVGFEVLTAASMKMAVFWVVAPCSLVEVYQRFRGTCCLHHQDVTTQNTVIFSWYNFKINLCYIILYQLINFCAKTTIRYKC
jgi:hypothetical protein